MNISQNFSDTRYSKSDCRQLLINAAYNGLKISKFSALLKKLGTHKGLTYHQKEKKLSVKTKIIAYQYAIGYHKPKIINYHNFNSENALDSYFSRNIADLLKIEFSDLGKERIAGHEFRGILYDREYIWIYDEEESHQIIQNMIQKELLEINEDILSI